MSLESRKARRRALRLASYIKENKVDKASKLLLKYPTLANTDLTHHRKQTSPLHLATKLGHLQISKLLIRHEADVEKSDEEGCVPIYCAAKFCLKNGGQGLELVELLLQRSERVLDLSNSKNITARAMVTQAMRLGEQQQQRPRVHEGRPNGLDGASWLDRLAEEALNDFADQGGFRDIPLDTFKADSETFDAWADRIYREFRRRNAQKQTSSSSSNNKREEEDKSDEKNEKKPKLELRLKSELPSREDVYRQKCALLFASSPEGTIHLSDLPFDLNSPSDEVVAVMLAGVEGESECRKCIKEELRRWHPDKFVQRFTNSLPKNGQERQKVIDVVTYISRCLLSFGEMN